MKIESLLSQLSDRSRNIVKHLGWSVFFKAGSLLANFMLVPITLGYLGKGDYGLWLTLSSFIAWFSLFDVGLGNGLRNKFAEAKAHQNMVAVKGYVSTAYFSIAAISLFMFVVFLIANAFINWAMVFNASPNQGSELLVLMPFVVGFFCLQLAVKLIISMYQADQHHSIDNKVQFFIQILLLCVIWMLLQLESSSLLWLGIIFSAIPPIVLALFNVYGFNTVFKQYKPCIRAVSKVYFKDITSLGLKFFVIQIAATILFTTDNFIISHLYGPEEVVPYHIAMKYFSILLMGYGILTAPLWSTFTDAYTRNDLAWIENTISKVQRIWLFGIPLSLLLMLLLSDWLYHVWIGKEIIIPLGLSVGMAFFVSIATFGQVYIALINGAGKVGLQLFVSVIVIMLNIPLSLYFAIGLNLGSIGIILSTNVCMIIPAVLWRVQYGKLINRTAYGIWDK
jgi:O-antigen/teichoic acid export membrane protein